MPVIQPLLVDSVSESLQAIFMRSKQLSGSNNAVRTYAHNPHVLQSFLPFFNSLWEGSIDNRTKQKIRYRIASKANCNYCLGSFEQSRIERLGLTMEDVHQINDYENSDLPELEKTMLKLADKMIANDISDNEAIYSELRRHLNEGQIVELTMSIGVFIGFSRMNRFLDLEFD